MKHTFLLRAAFAALIVLPLALLAAAPRTKPDRPEHISHGAEIKTADYLVPGKTVVFDFYSEFCPPCRAIAPELEKLHAKNANVVVVKVDINRADVRGIDWKSPVARQYALESIPHFKIYGPDGKLVAEGDAAEEKVDAMIAAK